MFRKEGFLSAPEAWDLLFQSGASQVGLAPMSRRERQKVFCREFWSFAASVDFVYLMDRNGTVTIGSSHLLMTSRPETTDGFFFSIVPGILGRFLPRDFGVGWRRSLILIPFVWAWFAVSRWINTIIARMMLTPFVGLSIMFRKEQIDAYLSIKEPASGDDGQVLSEKAAADLIVQMFDEGRISSRKSAEHALLPRLSGKRAFGRAWVIATECRPELSKPGRRGAA